MILVIVNPNFPGTLWFFSHWQNVQNN